MNKGIKS